MSTPHNKANVKEIAKTVIMCGDPLRAKFITETYLENYKLVNEVRNIYCYTGTYKGKEISVMAHGMGNPSMGIYSYELFNHYDVDTIIRVGTCGAYQENIGLKDVIVAVGACSDSNYASQFNLNGVYSATADYSLLRICDDVCKRNNIKANFGNVLATDIFYSDDTDGWKKWADLGVLAAEMESYALYINAAKAKKKALTMLSVSDSFITKTEVSVEDRKNGFADLMKAALDVALEA